MDRVILAVTLLFGAAVLLSVLLLVMMDRDGIVVGWVGAQVRRRMVQNDRTTGLLLGSGVGGGIAWAIWVIGLPWVAPLVGGLIGVLLYRLIGFRAAQETIRLRAALNRSMIVFLDQILLYASYPPLEMIRVMASFPSRRTRELRGVCQTVLERVRRNEGLPFGLLDAIAAEVDAVWFRRLTAVMVQYEQHGTPFHEALQYLRDEYMVEQDIEFRRRMQRAQFIVIGVSALAVMSMPLQILYTMIAGSDLALPGLW